MMRAILVAGAVTAVWRGCAGRWHLVRGRDAVPAGHGLAPAHRHRRRRALAGLALASWASDYEDEPVDAALGVFTNGFSAGTSEHR